MGRAPCCDKANVKKGPWSPEEDATLKSYIEKNGTGGNWIALPKKIGLKRCGKSCRLRWLNYLRPNIKHGGFSEEEDNIICNLYISIGSRWSIIAAQLPERTDNDIKNYWNTRLKKKLLGKRKQSNNNNLMNQKDTDNDNNYSLSSSALERLQLHMQLQNLQNPISFYNNTPASTSYSSSSLFWPKLHPSQEKIIHNSLQNSNNVMQNSLPSVPQVNNHNYNDNNYNYNNSSVAPMRGTEEGVHHVKSTSNDQLQNELDDILKNNKNIITTLMEEEVDEFDCFKDMNKNNNNCSKDESLMWWSNDSDTKSGSSNSWDSSTNLMPPHQGIMFQDYELDYSL